MRHFISFLLLAFTTLPATAQLALDLTMNPQALAKRLLLDTNRIKLLNIQYTGYPFAKAGFRYYGENAPIPYGILLSTGTAEDAVGPNNKTNSGENNFAAGDAELSRLANEKTFDAACLEFDFMANSDSIAITFSFASEEYPEFVNKGKNDVFAFYITDYTRMQTDNIARLKGDLVSVDNINSQKNSPYYIANAPNEPWLMRTLQYDGITKAITCWYQLTPYQLYHFKIAIADVGDPIYDSAILLKARSFHTGKDQELKEVYTELLQEDFIHIQEDSTGIYIIPNIQFAFDSYAIPDHAIENLERLHAILQRYFDLQIELSGHTDNIGEDAYNQDLSKKRALAVANYLKQKQISPFRMRAVGYGSLQPLLNNNTAYSRAQNRRVTLRLYRKK